MGVYMPWIALENASPEDAGSIRELLAELEHDSDRAAGIVGAVLVDESLSALIKTRFEADQDLISDMFRALGPLGSFSAEITLGFLMGLYSKAAWKELEHQKDSQRICAPCRAIIFFPTHSGFDKSSIVERTSGTTRE
jgi:hypothetical protein